MSDVTTGPWERRNELAGQILAGMSYANLPGVFQKSIDQMIDSSTCKHCGEPIEWDTYWTTWDHSGREDKLHGKLYAELCQPELGFDGSKYAQP